MDRFFSWGVRKKKRSNDNDLYEYQIMIIDFLPEWRKRRREAKQVLGTARVLVRKAVGTKQKRKETVNVWLHLTITLVAGEELVILVMTRRIGATVQDRMVLKKRKKKPESGVGWW